VTDVKADLPYFFIWMKKFEKVRLFAPILNALAMIGY
jgi:hypothetical protein